jgi:hypothetical protein
MKPIYFYVILVSILLSFQSSNAQRKNDIIGIWTDADAYGSDTYGDTYIFKEDLTFKFTFSGYEWAGRRIISFNGKYHVSNDSIYLQVTETTELVGGHLEYDGPSGTGWVIANGQEKVIEQTENNQVALKLFFESKMNHRYLSIEDHKFILFDKNPNAQFQY